MHLKTVIGDSVYFTSSFVRNHGIYLGDPTEQKPYIPRGHRLIADMVFELDMLSTVPLTQDVSNDSDYALCYQRFKDGQSTEIKISVELYLVNKSDINRCEVEYVDSGRTWP